MIQKDNRKGMKILEKCSILKERFVQNGRVMKEREVPGAMPLLTVTRAPVSYRKGEAAAV